jgi:hypothetical protein
MRAVPRLGQTLPTDGQSITLTGKLAQESALYGPVLNEATITQLGSTETIRPTYMSARSLGGRDARVGGTSQQSLCNIWSLVRASGVVSGFATGAWGCSFFISDGSAITDNLGRGVKVTSRFAAPSGLQNGSFAGVTGISQVSRTTGRQIEAVTSDAIRVYRTN